MSRIPPKHPTPLPRPQTAEELDRERRARARTALWAFTLALIAGLALLSAIYWTTR